MRVTYIGDTRIGIVTGKKLRGGMWFFTVRFDSFSVEAPAKHFTKIGRK